MIKLVCVGKIKDKHLTALINDYSQRISHFDSFNIIEVNNSVVKDESNDALIALAKKQEGNDILKNINNDDYVIALDLHGKQYPSEQVTKWLETANMNFKGKICFVIAGSYGYDKGVIERSNVRWSLSESTFLHTITRLLVVEQIYRGLMIKNHKNYHK